MLACLVLTLQLCGWFERRTPKAFSDEHRFFCVCVWRACVHVCLCVYFYVCVCCAVCVFCGCVLCAVAWLREEEKLARKYMPAFSFLLSVSFPPNAPSPVSPFSYPSTFSPSSS